MNKSLVIVIPSLKPGGSERVATELANYASRKGYSVSIIIMVNDEPFFSLNEDVELYKPCFKKKNRFIYYFKIIFFIRKTILRLNVDRLICFGYREIPPISTLFLNIELVGSHRTSPDRKWTPLNGNSLFHHLFGAFYHSFVKFIMNRYSKLIVQSEYAKSKLVDKYSATCKFEVIPNFLRPISDLDVKKENYIICVGRLSEEKGQKYLLESFSRIKNTNWKLILVGDGPQRKNLEEYSIQLNIFNRVKFIGFTKNVDFYLQSSKIFVLPSLIEGFPNALLEAMANGLACISFDCKTGPSELIEHGKNGYLVRVGDVNSLHRYLAFLIENNLIRDSFGREAEKVKQKYSIELIGAKYLDFIFK